MSFKADANQGKGFSGIHFVVRNGCAVSGFTSADWPGISRSRHATIRALLEDDTNRCCPHEGCHSTDQIVSLSITDDAERFKCLRCGQVWSVAYELIFNIALENPHEEKVSPNRQ